MEIPKESQLRDFRNVLYIVWEHLWQSGAIVAAKPDPTEIQYDIANYLQANERRIVIEAFRGIGKSWITSTYVVWRLLLNPNLNFLVVSASKDRSDQFTVFTKRLIHEISLFKHLAPKENQRNSNIAFDVGPAGISHSPSVKSVGITGQLTGSRADEIIADDVESLNNSMTQTMRDQLSERIKEFDAIIKPNGKITYLGTPQTEMSIYNKLPERGYKVRIWPTRIPKDVDKYNGKLAPYIVKLIEQSTPVGTPTDPQRFTNEDLREREASYGRSGFALQFMLDTSLSDAEKFPLKLQDLIVMPLDTRMSPVKLVWSSGPQHIINDVPCVGMNSDKYYKPMWTAPDMAEYTGSVMFIDPSGRGKDETAYAVVKMLNGWLFLVDIGGLKEGYSDDSLKALASAAEYHKVNQIVVESNFGDGMFTQLFKPILNRVHPCSIEEVRVNTQKEKRIIDTLEPVMNQHRLVIDKQLIKKDYDSAVDPKCSLFYQMTRITKDKGSLTHDDRLDALAGAVAFWVDHMGRDTERAEEEHKEYLRELELDRFRECVLGHSDMQNKGWCDW